MISKRMFWMSLSALLLWIVGVVCAAVAGTKVMNVGNGQNILIIICLTLVAGVSMLFACECWDKRY